ncbi:MAG: hypothetical protein A3D28_02335 [Omnitrophica bacterium RIFCSPHIGHO2_02_FULL_63_14]|nr:MAG: hypothetical protein A3D28_02335 [Omnitrophica bacterium RIFCSPHIGHO2_02_FULL_63_14]
MNVAYVEDDRDSRAIFSAKFRADGIRCDAFGDAESALEAIRPGAHDALVIDIRLPKMSGVELLSKLRQRGVFAPCVLITAFGSLGLMKQAVNSGASYLLEKPFSYAELRRVIDKAAEPPASLQHFVDRGLVRLGLTEREEDIARLILKGLSNGEIARVSGISDKTVKQYATQIFGKAGVESRAELFAHIFPT